MTNNKQTFFNVVIAFSLGSIIGGRMKHGSQFHLDTQQNVPECVMIDTNYRKKANSKSFSDSKPTLSSCNHTERNQTLLGITLFSFSKMPILVFYSTCYLCLIEAKFITFVAWFNSLTLQRQKKHCLWEKVWDLYIIYGHVVRKTGSTPAAMNNVWHDSKLKFTMYIWYAISVALPPVSSCFSPVHKSAQRHSIWTWYN